MRRAHLRESFKPAAVVDIATLTGACVIALGHVATGLFANDEELADEILAAGDDAWDRAWHMPLWDDYQEQLQLELRRHRRTSAAARRRRDHRGLLPRALHARRIRGRTWTSPAPPGRAAREKGSTGRPVPLLARFAAAQRAARVTRIDFYFNAEDRLQVACRLAAKACEQTKRMLVYAPRPRGAASASTGCCGPARRRGFVPHCAPTTRSPPRRRC